ncbi:MAG: nucleotidyltransferase family protein [Candidatus Nanopelagicales bacterium]|nr:nucleotidyltransferase family protein [Candidatus Nanopelagicales bacterium]
MDLAVDCDALADVCQRYGLSEVAVFGSVARGTAGPTSDVDVLYSLAPDSSLGWDIEEVARELGEIFGRPVDLVARRGLHPRLASRVLSEAKMLYAA